MTLFNYISGEPVTGLNDGRPLLVRRKDSKLSLANFMRSQIYSIFASLAVGHRILHGENVRIKRLTGHGGLFKTPGVAQRYLAAAMDAPVTVMKTAGEGGPYGMALLAAYLLHAKETTLEDYLENVAFAGAESSTMEPDAADVAGYKVYLQTYCDALDLEHTAVIMTQTGGGCRASNYIGFVRRALDKAGIPQIPVISLNVNGMETNPGFRMTPRLLTKAMQRC